MLLRTTYQFFSALRFAFAMPPYLASLCSRFERDTFCRSLAFRSPADCHRHVIAAVASAICRLAAEQMAVRARLGIVDAPFAAARFQHHERDACRLRCAEF